MWLTIPSVIEEIGYVFVKEDSHSIYFFISNSISIPTCAAPLRILSFMKSSNAQQVIENVKKELVKSEATLPDGLHFEYMVDASEFLSASIDEVWHTLIIAFILVFIVVFIFLQDFRSTLIPAIAVPVAIVGTFFFLLLFNFSINLLTLFALILAIGIVVDDESVVVEAVHAMLDEG